nr:hypothetical protein [Tanacetum cinerariifolium]
TEVVEGSSKRAREELTQERSKKQKIDDDQETAELKKLIEVILIKEEVAIDVIPLLPLLVQELRLLEEVTTVSTKEVTTAQVEVSAAQELQEIY